MAYGLEGFAERQTARPLRLGEEVRDLVLGLQRVQLAPWVALETGVRMHNWIKKTGGVVDLTHEWDTAVSRQRAGNDNEGRVTLEKAFWDTVTLGSAPEDSDPFGPEQSYANRGANAVILAAAIAGAVAGSFTARKHLAPAEHVADEAD